MLGDPPGFGQKKRAGHLGHTALENVILWTLPSYQRLLLGAVAFTT